MANNIISMSVWGENPRYIKGALKQIKLADKYFPDWKVRIYTDNPSNFERTDTDVVSLYDVSNGHQGAFWRFFPLFESKDNIVMVRDSDSRITIREARAVEEWLESGKSFHAFRDHDAHYEFPIMAGTFSYKGMLPQNLLEIMKMRSITETGYLNDQIYLRDFVWNLVKDDCLIHSMREPGWFSETRNALKNKYSFCGNGYTEEDLPIYSDSLSTITDFVSIEENKFDEGVLHEQ